TRLATESLTYFCNPPATTEIYTLSLHDALPISHTQRYCPKTISGPDGPNRPDQTDNNVAKCIRERVRQGKTRLRMGARSFWPARSEEHTSELQSRENLVCRLLLEKKNKKINK